MDNTAKGFAQKIISELSAIKELVINAVSHPDQEHRDSQRYKGQPATCQAERAPGSDSFIPEPQPPIACNRDTAQENQPRFPRLTQWKPVFEVAGLAFLIIYTTVSVFLWCESRRANDATEAHFRLGERAWMEVKPKREDLKLADFENLDIPLVVTNVGKTPATSFDATLIAEIVEKNSRPPLDFKTTGVRSTSGIIFPNAPIDGLSGGPPNKITESQRKELAAGNTYLVFYGIANFKDIFGVAHWTKFCFWRGFGAVDSTYNAKTCTDYNSVDAN